MDSSKTYKKDNILLKLLKANGDICSIIITLDLNRCITNGTLPINLKYADITPIFKKNDPFLKINYRPVSILPLFLKFMKKFSMYKFTSILIRFSLNTYADLGRVIAHSIACYSC